MSVSKALERSKAVSVLLALLDEGKHIRGLQKSTGGSPTTIQRRVEQLIETDLIQEVGGRGARRDLELTAKGRSVATLIASMDEVPSVKPKKPFLERRQRWMLTLLYGVGKVHGTTRLEKLLFLLKEEHEVVDENYYHFKPHIFGPYPLNLSDDIADLRAREIIEVEQDVLGRGEMGDWIYLKKAYGLTPEGDKKAKSFYEKFCEESRLVEAMHRMHEFNVMPLNSLLSYIWKRYPEYSRSEHLI